MLTMFRLAGADAFTQTTAGGALRFPADVQSSCRLATGRSALSHLIARLPKPQASTVLLPAYVAEGVIKPFQLAGFSILFYRLQADLSPVTTDLATLLARVEGKALLVIIHYFGFPVHSAELTTVLARYQPIVVDDYAHALFSTSADGEPLAAHSELALYSLNKFLPVTDGAILTSKRPDIDLRMDEQSLCELPLVARTAYQNHLQAGRALFDTDDPALAKAALQKLGECYEQYYAVINTDLNPCRQSADARELENHYACAKLVENRVQNSRIVYKELRSASFSLVYPTLPGHVVPWCIPARVPAQQRTAIVERLFEQGILLSTLADKWDFIPQGQREHFSAEAAFLREHVLIPVSEFITPAAMRDMVEKINQL